MLHQFAPITETRSGEYYNVQITETWEKKNKKMI